MATIEIVREFHRGVTVKEYLSQVFLLRRLISTKESHIQQLQDQQMCISGMFTQPRVQTSRRSDPMAELTVKLLDLIEEYKCDIERLVDIEREIKNAIDVVKRDDYRLILYERYINLKQWEDIAADNNYSWQWVHKLHTRALKEIEQAIESESKNLYSESSAS